MALSFIKDTALYSVELIGVSGTFVVEEFFRNDLDNTKVGEVVSYVDNGGGNSTIEYILIGTSATQFANGDSIIGDGSGNATINSSPIVSGFKDVHVIQVDLPDVSVDIQDLINKIRSYEEQIESLDHPSIANASGKQNLGGGTLVGITLELLDNWRIQFEPRQGPVITAVSVVGGNLVATNSYGNNPIKASPFTQVTVARSSSATISELQIQDLVHRIENLRDTHPKFGKIIYWNPADGDDNNIGNSDELAVATFAKAQELATSGAGDVICLCADTENLVETSEQITITKNGLSLRGPGHEFRFTNQSTAGPTITVQANNVSLSGFCIEHNGGSATHAIYIQGSSGNLIQNVLVDNIHLSNIEQDGVVVNYTDHTQVRNLHFDNITNGNGISINNSTNAIINRNKIQRCTGAGIYCGNYNIEFEILRNYINNNDGPGIDINGMHNEYGSIEKNTLSSNQWGVNISNGQGNRVLVSNDNINVGNSQGNIKNESALSNIQSSNAASIFA